MSYRQDNLRGLKNTRFLLVILFVAIIFYFFSNFILNKGFDILSFVALPLWRLENWAEDSLGQGRLFFRSKKALLEENQKISYELDNIKMELDASYSLKEQNQELMVQMGREVPAKSTLILANILSGPNVPPYESLIVDVSKIDGVSVGDRVIYGPNILLGEISQIFGQSSKVRLYSASGIQTNVLIPSTEVWHAVANGYGGGNFSIELPSRISIKKGMQILIPGIELYVLGVVGYVKVDLSTASQRVLIRYPVNLKKMRFVHIIKSSANEYLE